MRYGFPRDVSPEVWHGAEAEQLGIETWLATPVARPRIAWVDYDAAALIYGRSGGVSVERQRRAAQSGCKLFARRTGGGAVLAGPWMLGMHLWLPSDHALAGYSAVQSMRALGQTLCRALDGYGFYVRSADKDSMSVRNSQVKALGLEWSCYADLSHGELVDASGKKCFGLSQARTSRGVLFSTGLLLGPTPWTTLEYVHSGTRTAYSAMTLLAGSGLDASQDIDRSRLKRVLDIHMTAWLETLEPETKKQHALVATLEE